MSRDAAAPVYERVDQDRRVALGRSRLDALLESHRNTPFGPHSDALARLLNYFRGQPTLGKYLIVGRPGEAGWRLAKITGRREEGSVEVEETLYPRIEDAEHAVFVARLRDSGMLPDADERT